MKRLFLIPCILMFTAVAFADPLQGEENVVVLSIGRSTEWSVPQGVSIHVSNGRVIRVVDEKAKIRIIAKKIGESEIRYGEQKLTVQVLSDSDRSLFHRLSATVRELRGLEVKMQGPAVAVTGRLLRFDDWQRLARAAGSGAANFSFRATMSPELAATAASRLQKILRDAHLPEVAIELQPIAVATAPTEPNDLKIKVEQVLKPFGFRVDASTSALSLEPMVRVRLLVAEIRKSMSRKFGLQWPPSFPAQLLPTPRLGDGSPLLLSLNALEENGVGKILASPTLLCRSGKEAHFLAGGEIPIKIVNYKVQDIIWKQYGVLLKIRPRADFSGRMSIGIETEVSMIDAANKVDGIPGLLTNRIESHFDLSSSRTIVLSGLIKKEWGESASGLPGLVNIPILGALFGSRDYRDDRTELVVFVTPEVAHLDEETI